jgi:peptidoglycan glycosyltransferase
MPFAREINRLVLAMLAAVGVVAVAAAYWAIAGPDTILLRQDNPRLVEAEASILRGSIFDRHDILLAKSQRDPAASVTRRYIFPAMNSALGYFSLRYGVGGAESAYNATLRGDTLGRDFTADLLHQPKQGADIRLTFDLNIQRAIAQALQTHTGAVVVLAVPSGEVLALVSSPTFNPNTLDADWASLTKAPGKPFFNRAIQGNYQPGGMLQTPLMAAALLSNRSMDTTWADATDPVAIADVRLRCAADAGQSALTLREAYLFACPKPFVDLVNDLGYSTIQDTFNTFRLDTPPSLPGFVAEAPDQITPTPRSTLDLTPSNMLENALGQGTLTVTPLEMAMIAAAILNEGNAPQPYTLLATRTPTDSAWIETPNPQPAVPITTANTARQLQDMMREALDRGAAQPAKQPNVDMGGHAALAYSGEGAQAWFIGFTAFGSREGVAVAVVLENTSDPRLAARIGGDALATAAHLRQP